VALSDKSLLSISPTAIAAPRDTHRSRKGKSETPAIGATTTRFGSLCGPMCMGDDCAVRESFDTVPRWVLGGLLEGGEFTRLQAEAEGYLIIFCSISQCV